MRNFICIFFYKKIKQINISIRYLVKKNMNEEIFYCPYCGALQKKGQQFCSSCGASLEFSDSPPQEEKKVQIIKETPVVESTSVTTPQPQPSPYGAYPSAVPSTPAVPARDNAIIALILGIVGFFVNCFIFPIIGLIFVKKAEENNEDRGITVAAKVLNWILMGLTILSIIGLIIYLILFFTIGFSY